MEKRIILISNRLPVTIKIKGKSIEFVKSVGGLATGMSYFFKNFNCKWIGWCGLATDFLDSNIKKEVERRLIDEHKNYPVFLSRENVKNYYSGFCNRTIWPLFHYFPESVVYRDDQWKSYKKVNEIFFQTAKKIVKPDDIIWVHDYHLFLLPAMLKKEFPQSQIGYFLHIPFPSYELFRLLPWSKAIIQGIMGADLIGFHTYDYVRHFTSSVRRILGYDHEFGHFSVDHRLINVDSFPMGIDYNKFYNVTPDKKWEKEICTQCSVHKGCKIILSVDRLDYSKGIPNRLEAFDYFLDKYPEFKKRVVLIMIAVPSRTGVQKYRNLKKYVDELVGRINGKHGSIGWNPVVYMYRALDFKHLTTLYELADVCLVTPIRDGMNLIAKEYIATRKHGKGVLILSSMAGAVSELAESIIVNPNDREEVADSIEHALQLPEEEQIRRNRIMQNRIKKYDIKNWAWDFMDRLSHIKSLQKEITSSRLIKKSRNKLIENYRKSKKRIIFLDYDGTLVPFSKKYDEARPDEELIKILKKMNKNIYNRVVIISGRDKETLDNWFGNLDLDLCAEHGAWVKEKKDKQWRLIESMSNKWKNEIKPILEKYCLRTPGSKIEEKTFSLAWHYRNVNPELGEVRKMELKEDLIHFTYNKDLSVLEGSKVIEVKNSIFNKGRGLNLWLNKEDYDFVLFIGDDWTDEDAFKVLDDKAYSIKVGYSSTNARFFLFNHLEVRDLLNLMIK